MPDKPDRYYGLNVAYVDQNYAEISRVIDSEITTVMAEFSPDERQDKALLMMRFAGLMINALQVGTMDVSGLVFLAAVGHTKLATERKK